MKVVQRDLDAVNYLHRSGSTQIGFKGTTLLPLAKGEAKVTSERGGIHIEAKFQGLTPANGFGPEYLTYVLWAITPDGRPNNLGEVLPAGTKNNIDVTTALQSFGMIVTAEPYFSVTQPSDVVVLQNVILNDKTAGVLEKVNAHYLLLPRGTYAQTEGAKTIPNPITRDEKSPLELYQANNAIRIAQAAGADKYAPEIMKEAMQDLQNATAIDQNKKGDRKMEITFARQAVQRAEDARLVTLRRQAAERQLNAENAKRDAQARRSSRSWRLSSRSSPRNAPGQHRPRPMPTVHAPKQRPQRLRPGQQPPTRVLQDANAVREKLRGQLNSVLATSESARGLIVNMSDVLFDTGKYTLKPETQISLAKVSGILQAYPGLKLQVEGYTDSVGSDELQPEALGESGRCGAGFPGLAGGPAGQYFGDRLRQGEASGGQHHGAGRAQNRRVQLVVSGDAIGVEQSSPDAAPASTSPQ